MRRYDQWSAMRLIVCISSRAREITQARSRAYPLYSPEKISFSWQIPPYQLSQSLINSTQKKNLSLLVACSMSLTHFSLCFHFPWLWLIFSIFLLIYFRLPLHVTHYLNFRGKRITVARSAVILRLIQDALGCTINILSKGFSSDQQYIAPANAQVIRLKQAFDCK